MNLPRIAVTCGDPAGIGPELCLRLLEQTSLHRACTPFVVADHAVLERVARQLSLPVPEVAIPANSWPAADSGVICPAVIDLATGAAAEIAPGVLSAAGGRASFQYIEYAIEQTLAGRFDAVVTGPINKEALRAAGIDFPGHTEIFTTLTGAPRSCMLLTSSALSCSFVTAHVGYRDVPALLSMERILDAIEMSADTLQRIRQREPRLLVCGLNPHAGEHGLFGDQEEERYIIPAVEEAVRRGLRVEGPLPPDTAFLPRRRQEVDCFVCMYHDQGHIPLKALAFDEAVNVTLGLPIVRTSVDHGTAFDIAWQGVADASSLYEALGLATRLCGQPAPVPTAP